MNFSSRTLYWLTSLLALVAAGATLLHPIPAVADERMELGRPQMQASVARTSVAATTLTSSKVSHWQFLPNGTVEATRSGLGNSNI